ncbi:hypothetical protein UPYG_G00290570 [Umbra pygmaea]|uniref:Selenoprotein P N-terminal domain-containing protein n=1 Tax=Umbra pygmaea TaxID=75934 RepID=A0ABD0W570_UMBPY
MILSCSEQRYWSPRANRRKNIQVTLETENAGFLVDSVAVCCCVRASTGIPSASKLGGLRAKLLLSNLTDVSFLIVNEQKADSRAMYWELKRKTSPGIPVYQQAPLQDDIWEALGGDKDDFLVYDRCGRLTFHIVLPYSFLHYPYIEAAIRATYHKDICGNCTVDFNSTSLADVNSTQQESRISVNEQPIVISTTTHIENSTASNPTGGQQTVFSQRDKNPRNLQTMHNHNYNHHQKPHDHYSRGSNPDYN